VDQRADLYALGATLYELATGGPPFGAGDPLRLIHDHLARLPTPPAEANRALPAPLSAIIMHLVAAQHHNGIGGAAGRTDQGAAQPIVEADPQCFLAQPGDRGGVVGGGGRRQGRGRQEWLLPAPDGGTVSAGDAGREGAVAASVLRYVQRTREPLVVADAVGDDRFARDPYYADVDCCSLLAVPIVSRGLLRAVLLLENRLPARRVHRGAAGFGQADGRAARGLPGQRSAVRRAHQLAGADRRRRRPGAAADRAGRRCPVPVDLRVQAKERLPEPVEVSAYYVVAEALTNAAKHARASAVGVEAEIVGDLLRITVRDDGVGGAALDRGTGIAGLKDRVEALGGRIVLHSPQGSGTSLLAELPLTAADGVTS
jgi:hypothetical protein